MKKLAMVSVCLWLGCAGMPNGGGNGGGGNGGNGGGAGNGSGGNGGSGGDGNGGSGGMSGGGSAGSGGGGSAGSGGGSGGSGGDVPEYVSGSRLRARVITGSDGAKQLVGWHDSMLNIDCAFNLAADGQQRCLPSTYAIAGTYFGDSGCSTKLAYLPTSYVVACPASIATWSEPTTTCTSLGYPAAKVHIFAVAGQYNGAMVWSGTPANCVSETTSAITTVTFYSLGSETAATTYAAGTISVE